MRTSWILPWLALAAGLPCAAHADAALRASIGILQQRSADLDDRVEAAQSIGRSYGAEGATALAEALDDPHPAIREAAADALWSAALSDRPGAREAVAAVGGALRSALADESPAVAARAASALEAAGTPRVELAPVRRALLAARGPGPYPRFLAARGLIGIDPPQPLAAALVEWGTDLHAAEAAGRRGSIQGDLELFDRALARLLREGGPGAADALAAQAQGASPIVARVLVALGAADPPPAGWVDLLLDATASPHAPTRERAWSLLGAQRASAARWLPRAIAALDDDRGSLPALGALRGAAGCCAEGLERIADLALDPPSAEVQAAALQVLAAASDATSPAVAADVLPPARAAALRAFAPLLGRLPAGDAFDAARRGLMFTERDDAARAALLAQAIRANPDPAARIALIDALSPSGTRGALAADAVRPFVDAPDAATREAALRALSAIAPAWRASEQRATSGAARAVAPAAPGAPGVPLMKLFEVIRGGDAAALAKLVPREKANAALRMPDGSAPGDAPLDAAVSHCGLPMMDTPRLLMVFRTLLAQGADPERPGGDGDTPLTKAGYACPPEVQAVLAGG